MKKLLMLFLLSSVFNFAAYSEENKKHEGSENRPCKSKAEARHEARKALRECIEAWAKDSKPGDADPSDNCNSKLSTFIQTSKDLKACRTENMKK